MECETCHTVLPRQTAGRPRKFCSKECRVLNEAIVRMEKALGPVNARLMAGTNADRQGLVDLRYRIFTLIADEMDRPRIAAGTVDADGKKVGGRFIKRTV